MPVFVFTNHLRDQWHKRAAIYGDETDKDIAKVVYESVRLDPPPAGFPINSGDSVWYHKERGLYFVVDVSDREKYVVITVLTDEEIPGKRLHRSIRYEIDNFVQTVKKKIHVHRPKKPDVIPLPPPAPISLESAKIALQAERSRRPESFTDLAAQLDWVTTEHQRIVSLTTNMIGKHEVTLRSVMLGYQHELKSERKYLRSTIKFLAKKEMAQ